LTKILHEYVTNVTSAQRLDARPLRVHGHEGRMQGGSKGSGKRRQERRVSVQLDPVIWEALRDIAEQQKRSITDLVEEIARDSLYIAIHVYIAEFYRANEQIDE
jgi:hypothetical protein